MNVRKKIMAELLIILLIVRDMVMVVPMQKYLIVLSDTRINQGSELLYATIYE